MPQDDKFHIFVSVHQSQGQDLSTISPAIIFESMFQNSDDTAIQEDPQQTGLCHRLSSYSRLGTGQGSESPSVTHRCGRREVDFSSLERWVRLVRAPGSMSLLFDSIFSSPSLSKSLLEGLLFLALQKKRVSFSKSFCWLSKIRGAVSSFFF